jgi:hypothetical protein
MYSKKCSRFNRVYCTQTLTIQTITYIQTLTMLPLLNFDTTPVCLLNVDTLNCLLNFVGVHIP